MLEGYEIECPWYGSKFDVRTGEVTNPPASEPERTYEVKVDDNNILTKMRSNKVNLPSNLSDTIRKR